MKLLPYLNFARHTTGHALASAILLSGGTVSAAVETVTNMLAKLVAALFGAQVNDLSVDSPTFLLSELGGAHASLFCTCIHYQPDSEGALGTGLPQIIDEKKSLDARRTQMLAVEGKNRTVTDLRMTSEKLIELSHEVLRAEFGTMKPELLAEDFRFVFPVVGPLSKKEFVDAFSSFGVRETFPGTRGNFFGFTVDPLEPDRVWFFSRGEMTMSGPLKVPTFSSSSSARTSSHLTLLRPSHKRILTPPQALSMSFTADGKCYKLTGGYVVDRFGGASTSLGGFFGVLHALGVFLPFPEGRPWSPSPFWQAFILRPQEVIREWRKL
eukprot:g2538.t1